MWLQRQQGGAGVAKRSSMVGSRSSVGIGIAAGLRLLKIPRRGSLDRIEAKNRPFLTRLRKATSDSSPWAARHGMGLHARGLAQR